MKDTPLDDAVAESPHSRAGFVLSRSRAMLFPFMASTLRLMQNLGDVTTMVPGLDLQILWDNKSSVLQVASNSRTSSRSRKIPRRLQHEMFYHMAWLKHDAKDVAPGALADLDSDGEGPEDLKALTGDKVDAKLDEEAVLLREWLLVVLEPNMYISVREVDSEGSVAVAPMQVLRTKTQHRFAFSYEQQQEEVKKMKIAVQPLEVMGGLATEDKDTLDTFVADRPVGIDIVRAICSASGTRDSVRGWTGAESATTPGCVSLTQPKALAPKLSLGDAKCPILCLLDALRAQGYHAVQRRVVHRSGGKEYDMRKVTTKRFYFQCVLGQEKIWAAEVKEFKSTLSQSAYRLLLRCPRQFEERFSAKDCEAVLAKAEGDIALAQALQEQPSAPPTLASIAGDAGDDDVMVEAPGGASPLADADDDGADGAIEDGAVAPIAGDVGGVAVPKAVRICGVLAKVETHYNAAGAPVSSGLRVTCPTHAKCKKFRSFHLDREAWGDRGCEAFLGAWLRSATTCLCKHSRYTPTRADVQAYFDSC